ncbi:hypothetical protein [Thermomonospora umbrina]|uniref:Uncharacterized protein n=1 Tax=Thermomonospora umbrina TaxID=111806 RepID=A0A3D9SXP8_9ACTN|nr:hypothetical protein [Thermomonospora umbrina]REF00629.1 hypothetical protein DFJ69_6185 [Thermomonospora umbrina]
MSPRRQPADELQPRRATAPGPAASEPCALLDRDLAAQAWARITVPHIAQRRVMRRSPDGGLNFPRSSRSGYRYEVALRAALPDRPATVPTADARTGLGRLLVLDLDASRAPPWAAADRAAHVAAVAERIVALIAECGGRALVDVSPSGGRHVYVLWAAPRPHAESRRLVRAFARRFAVVDTSPMETSDGQIRGPGAPHRSQGGRLTGYMTLTCGVREAEEICAQPCGPQVWARLHDEFAAELAALDAPALEARHRDAPAAPLDERCEPFCARPGGRTRLRADLEETARTGRVDSARYPSRSEARQAVLASAAARGWRLEQVRGELAAGGAWTAIANWWRDDALLRAEWTKAIAHTTRVTGHARPPAPIAENPARTTVGNRVREGDTSGRHDTPPSPTVRTFVSRSPLCDLSFRGIKPPALTK